MSVKKDGTVLVDWANANVKAMEDLVRTRQRTNPQFAFLQAGEGADYYRDCLRKYSGGASVSTQPTDVPLPL